MQSLLYCIWLSLGVKRALSEEWIWSLSCCVLHRHGVNDFLVNWRWSGFSVCFVQKNMRKEWENIQCTVFSELPNSNRCLFLNSKGLVRIEKGKNRYLKTIAYETVISYAERVSCCCSGSVNSSLCSVSTSAKIQELLHSLPCQR